MTAIVATGGQNANLAGADSRNKIPQNVGTSGLMARCARTVFGRKTWAHLVGVLDVSERAAKSRMACEREFTADEIRALLQSEQGIHFLVALMGHARPAWWRAVLHMGLLGSIARRREADLRLLRKVADADRATAVTFPAALMVQDQEFFGPLLAGFDAMAASGAPSGSMDATPSARARR